MSSGLSGFNVFAYDFFRNVSTCLFRIDILNNDSDYQIKSLRVYLKCSDRSVAKIAFSIKSIAVECSADDKLIKILFI